jgi:hypothetical protein
MAKLRGKAKEVFLDRMAKGRAKAARRAGGKPHKKRPKGSAPKSAARTSQKAVAVRPVVQTIVVKGPSTMANQAGGKKPKRRMSMTVARPRRVTITNPRKRHHRRRRNPSFGGLIGTQIAGAVGGAAASFVGAKFLGAQSRVLQVGASVAFGILGAMLIQKKNPAMANAFQAGVAGSIGAVFGTQAGGGVAATNKADATAQLSRLNAATSTTPPATQAGSQGMGQLRPVNRASGMGQIQPRTRYVGV